MKKKLKFDLATLESMVLNDDELLCVNGGASRVNCGSGCGVGCGSGCGSGCNGCTTKTTKTTITTKTVIIQKR
ncbi:MAG: hypothetical protein HDS95_05040 [Bacteroidales bacterium]|nr:hypothetical protein [Bacteroidales bacterium]